MSNQWGPPHTEIFDRFVDLGFLINAAEDSTEQYEVFPLFSYLDNRHTDNTSWYYERALEYLELLSEDEDNADPDDIFAGCPD